MTQTSLSLSLSLPPPLSPSVALYKEPSLHEVAPDPPQPPQTPKASATPAPRNGRKEAPAAGAS